MVIRAIRNRIPDIDELNLPPVLRDIMMTPRGLVLVVGSTGSGKSTTLASMIDHRNAPPPGTSSPSRTRSNTCTATTVDRQPARGRAGRMPSTTR
jgi:ABC-type lipoprotein export system ATPase subunit